MMDQPPSLNTVPSPASCSWNWCLCFEDACQSLAETEGRIVTITFGAESVLELSGIIFTEEGCFMWHLHPNSWWTFKPYRCYSVEWGVVNSLPSEPGKKHVQKMRPPGPAFPFPTFDSILGCNTYIHMYEYVCIYICNEKLDL